MRALLLILVVAACGKSESSVEWTPVLSDRSLEFHGEILDKFCREQEREPGWTCDDYESCESTTENGLAVCRAKQAVPSR